jgi:hypothetical protein
MTRGHRVFDTTLLISISPASDARKAPRAAARSPGTWTTVRTKFAGLAATLLAKVN